jgi:hypothetical protein
LSTIIVEVCQRSAGIGVHVTLETSSFMTRNNQSGWASGPNGPRPGVVRLRHHRRLDAGATLIEAQIPDLARLVELTTIPIQNHDVRQALSDYLDRYHAGVTFEEVLAGASADVRRDVAVERLLSFSLQNAFFRIPLSAVANSAYPVPRGPLTCNK